MKLRLLALVGLFALGCGDATVLPILDGGGMDGGTTMDARFFVPARDAAVRDVGVDTLVDVGVDAARRDSGPMMNACPAGGSLIATLWRVYATPRKPDGRPWDGPTSSTRDLICGLGAEELRARITTALNLYLPGLGSGADELLGERFEEEVAGACGLVANWLTAGFEGPELFARGAFVTDLDWRWQSTVGAPNSWVGVVELATDGFPSSWEIPCGSTDQFVDIEVVDADLAIDDPVGVTTFDLALTDPTAICDGWGYIVGEDGVVGMLFKLEVVDAVPTCPGR